jgi:D-sedoheptulose 7-phosphate isomerase
MKVSAESFVQFGSEYIKKLTNLLNQTNISSIWNLLDVCETARHRGNTIYFAGNGGSAATASHFAADFLGANVKRSISPAYKTVSLCDNAAVTLAFGNDFGYEKIFENQLKSLFQDGDVLVVISASGNSPNVVKAVEWANENGGITFGLVGFDGGRLLEICHNSVLFRTEKGEYGPVEDFHMIIDHIINTFILSNF